MATVFQAASSNVLSVGRRCGIPRVGTFDPPSTQIYQRLRLTRHHFRVKTLVEHLASMFAAPMIENACTWTAETCSEHLRKRCSKQTEVRFEHIYLKRWIKKIFYKYRQADAPWEESPFLAQKRVCVCLCFPVPVRRRCIRLQIILQLVETMV